jgi:preprotein translocase subunit SecA
MGMVDRLGLPEDEPIEAKLITNTIENAQKRLEGENFSSRKTVLDYDDVMNQQREIIYKQRRQVLDGDDISGTIDEMVLSAVPNAMLLCQEDGKLITEEVKARLFWILLKEDDISENVKPKDLEEKLQKRVEDVYAAQKERFGEHFAELTRIALLRAVDTSWMQHLDAMDDLRDGIGLSSYAQRNPLVEYRIHGSEMFDEMIEKIREDTTRFVLFARPADENKSAETSQKRVEGVRNIGGKDAKKTPFVRKVSDKVGRNDPCPCGSGKKYKNCCGR